MCDQRVGIARMLAKGVRSRSPQVPGSTVNRCRFSSPFSSLRNMRYRPSGLHSCQLIGRPLVRVTGWPAATLPTGETQMFSTPSTGASHDNRRLSGDSFAPKNVGLSNSFRRGIRGRADIAYTSSLHAVAFRDAIGLVLKVYQTTIKSCKMAIGLEFVRGHVRPWSRHVEGCVCGANPSPK